MLDKDICFLCAKGCGRFIPVLEGVQYTFEKFHSDWEAGLTACPNGRIVFVNFSEDVYPPEWCCYSVEHMMKIGNC
jgi:hypothetical protein